ncbi:putative minor capsid protein [Ruegeria phage vB_RpoS-V10]|nr:putative minor capsid protein [Ruegeria phage vB_RpoS-V10]
MARSEVNYIYDAAAAFRAPGLAALTADATLGTFALDKLVNVRPSSQRGKLASQEYDIVIVVESAVTPNADETYRVNAVVDGVTVGSLLLAGAGQYVLCLDAATIEKVAATHASIALALDVSGTAPSIKLSAWIV